MELTVEVVILSDYLCDHSEAVAVALGFTVVLALGISADVNNVRLVGDFVSILLPRRTGSRQCVEGAVAIDWSLHGGRGDPCIAHPVNIGDQRYQRSHRHWWYASDERTVP